MAEALGVVASALQIADTALKLRKIWTNVQGMPDTVRNMLEDVNLLAELLGQIQTMSLPDASMQKNAAAWNSCLQTLLKVNVSFQSFVDDLDRQISVHKKTGSIKALLKQNKINELSDRLERLKSTMVLAQQAYTHALFTQQSATMIDAFQAISLQASPSSGDFRPATKTYSITKTDNASSLSLSSATTLSCNQASRPVQRDTRRFDIRLPQYILRKGLQVLISRSCGSWNMSLRVYNNVPLGSDVFYYARRGDWTGVQHLFDQGQASPFDIEDGVLSLIHIAAEEGDANGCRFLLGHGLKPHDVDTGYMTPLESFGLFAHNTKTRMPNNMELVRLLSPVSDEISLEKFAYFRLSAEAIHYLTTTVISEHASLQPWRRARSLLNFWGAEPECIQLILGSDLSLSQALVLLSLDSSAIPTMCHRDIIVNITRPFAMIMHDDDAVRNFAAIWRPVVDEVVAFERQTQLSLPFNSCIRSILYEESLHRQKWLRLHEDGQTWSQKLTIAIRAWIRFLFMLGVNLSDYAKAERSSFMNKKKLYRLPTPNPNFFYNISGLSCGPDVEDWCVYAAPAGPYDAVLREILDAEYEMAEEFWQWIENPEPFAIPGSYPDGDSSAEIQESDYEPIMIVGPVF